MTSSWKVLAEDPVGHQLIGLKDATVLKDISASTANRAPRDSATIRPTVDLSLVASRATVTDTLTTAILKAAAVSVNTTRPARIANVALADITATP